VGPFDDALGLRVGRSQDEHPRAQDAAERLTLTGEFAAPTTPPTHRALTIPHQHPRHRAQRLQLLPPAGEQVRAVTRRHQQTAQPPRVAAHHRQHRQPLGDAGLPEPDRQLDRREPEIALRDLPGHIRGARCRVRRQIHRAQLGHPATQHPDRPSPADPLRDHRRRHFRPRTQELTDPRLHLVHDRPRTGALIPRRRLGTQRRAHRVPRHPHHPSNRLDRHPLRPVQPADLRPILHA
jgi:hypothetical protein